MKETCRNLVAVLLGLALSLSVMAQTQPSTFTVIRATSWTTANFNPLVGPSAQPATYSALYETLFYINNLTGTVTNVLGTGYNWSNASRTLTVTVRDNVRWHDGEAFGADDVVFTFNYIKDNQGTDLNGIWRSGLASVAARGRNTVVFTFSEPNTPTFAFIASQPILPQHIWKDVKEPLTFRNEKPVGTGPFVLDSFSPQAVRLVKFSGYWMPDKPAIGAVVWLPAAGNDGALLRVLRNEGDFFFGGITDPQGSFASRGPNFQFWWPVVGFNFLYFNTTKTPFSDPAFRRAISLAINTKDVATKAYSGAIEAASPTAVVPRQQGQWLLGGANPSHRFDPKAADSVLTAAGYARGAQGQRLSKSGEPLPTFRILVGTGWGDYITMAQIISENLKQLGINTTIEQQPFSTYTSSLLTATYDMAISWGWGSGSTPYYLFFRSFSPDLSAPAGQPAASNISRYTNSVVTRSLETFRSSSDTNVQRRAIQQIVTTVMRDVPWVPLTNRANFSQFNTVRFTNFPSDENPYYDGASDLNIGFRLLLLNIRPR